MSIPPPKPPGPFLRGGDGRPELKGAPDGPGPSASDFLTPGAGTSLPRPSPAVYGPARDKKKDGYDSTAEEPPQSYYEGMSRDRDRKREPDAQKRKRARMLANAWTTFSEGISPDFYVRGPEHAYKQSGGYCQAVSGAFIHLRHVGFSVKQTIRLLKKPPVADMIPIWRERYVKYQVNHAKCMQKFFSYDDVIANSLSEIADAIREFSHRLPEKLSSGDAKKSEVDRRLPQSGSDIFFQRRIGEFFSGGTPPRDPDELKHMFRTKYIKGDHYVESRSHPPSNVRSQNFQTTLFASYQPCISRSVPRKHLGFVPTVTATPFVILRLEMWSDTKRLQEAHVVVVDFSDPVHPGIFDPNFGWMEPKQGFCFLGLEQALTSIWTFYTGKEKHTPQRQFSSLRNRDDDIESAVYQAFQIYVQSLPPVPAIPKVKSPSGKCCC